MEELCLHSDMLWKRVSLVSAALIAATVSPSALAAVQASLRIDQVSPSSYGVWTLIPASGDAITSSDPGVDRVSYSFGLSEFGPLTLTVAPPPGMVVKISTYRGGDLIESKETPQVSVNLFPNDNYRFLIRYSLSRLGSLGVTSDPSAIRFRMRGPTRKVYTAITPYTFANIPEGRYMITFPAPEGCLQPPPHAVIVEPGRRNVTHVTFPCNLDEQNSTESGSSARKSKRELREEVETRESRPRGERK